MSELENPKPIVVKNTDTNLVTVENMIRETFAGSDTEVSITEDGHIEIRATNKIINDALICCLGFKYISLVENETPTYDPEALTGAAILGGVLMEIESAIQITQLKDIGCDPLYPLYPQDGEECEPLSAHLTRLRAALLSGNNDTIQKYRRGEGSWFPYHNIVEMYCKAVVDPKKIKIARERMKILKVDPKVAEALYRANSVEEVNNVRIAKFDITGDAAQIIMFAIISLGKLDESVINEAKKELDPLIEGLNLPDDFVAEWLTRMGDQPSFVCEVRYGNKINREERKRFRKAALDFSLRAIRKYLES